MRCEARKLALTCWPTTCHRAPGQQRREQLLGHRALLRRAPQPPRRCGHAVRLWGAHHRAQRAARAARPAAAQAHPAGGQPGGGQDQPRGGHGQVRCCFFSGDGWGLPCSTLRTEQLEPSTMGLHRSSLLKPSAWPMPLPQLQQYMTLPRLRHAALHVAAAAGLWVRSWCASTCRSRRT